MGMTQKRSIDASVDPEITKLRNPKQGTGFNEGNPLTLGLSSRTKSKKRQIMNMPRCSEKSKKAKVKRQKYCGGGRRRTFRIAGIVPAPCERRRPRGGGARCDVTHRDFCDVVLIAGVFGLLGKRWVAPTLRENMLLSLIVRHWSLAGAGGALRGLREGNLAGTVRTSRTGEIRRKSATFRHVPTPPEAAVTADKVMAHRPLRRWDTGWKTVAQCFWVLIRWPIGVKSKKSKVKSIAAAHC